MTSRTTPWLSFLDALRPEPGWRTDVALMATYSADCTALVAAMLALAGRDDDRGSGSKVDVAEAFEQLKGRIHVLLQSGRLAVPRQRVPVLQLLDRILLPVEEDERKRSWHPKVALLRLSAEEGRGVQWRLWIGSRNLTRDQSLDTGLLCVSSADKQGAPVKGLEAAARRLFARTPHAAEDVERWCGELRRARWVTPDGVALLGLELLQPGDRRRYPAVPDDADEVVVVSPFIDGQTVAHFGQSGATAARRLLVSRLTDLQRLATTQDGSALSGYAQLLHFEAPPPQPGEPEAECSEAPPFEASDEEWQPQGLHAKLVMARSGPNWQVWLGSANATERGWHRNHELVVQLQCTRRVGDALAEMARTGREFDRTQVGETPQEEEVEQLLESIRTRLSAEWAAALQYQAAGGELVAEAPLLLDAGVQLDVGWLGGPRQEWLAGKARLHLPPGRDTGSTELFEFGLRAGPLRCEWVQHVRWDTELPEDRDLRVMARYLDHRTFMAWLRDQLAAEPMTEGGGDWGTPTKPPVPPGRPGASLSLPTWLPTLEEVLRATAQHPEVLAGVDRKLTAYLRHLPDDVPPQDRKALDEFANVWKLVRRELMEPAR